MENFKFFSNRWVGHFRFWDDTNGFYKKQKRINRIIKVPEEEPDGRHYDVSLNFMKNDERTLPEHVGVIPRRNWKFLDRLPDKRLQLWQRVLQTKHAEVCYTAKQCHNTKLH